MKPILPVFDAQAAAAPTRAEPSFAANTIDRTFGRDAWWWACRRRRACRRSQSMMAYFWFGFCGGRCLVASPHRKPTATMRSLLPAKALMRSGRSLPSVAVGVDSLPVTPKSVLALSSAGRRAVVERLVAPAGDVEQQADALALAVRLAASGSGVDGDGAGLALAPAAGRGGGGAARGRGGGAACGGGPAAGRGGGGPAAAAVVVAPPASFLSLPHAAAARPRAARSETAARYRRR